MIILEGINKIVGIAVHYILQLATECDNGWKEFDDVAPPGEGQLEKKRG